ncbi:MAG: ribonuclease P protein component [Tannerella sp.]|jgi:ribonuclease P protein component|nr:ribonuclease P protein component [Tannerella sp.]
MESAERNLFRKNERLCLKKDIDRLFSDGQTFLSYPLRIVYLPETGGDAPPSGISVLVSVPKKRIRRAVQRNRIKRLIREAFRLNKKEAADFCGQRGKRLHIAFMYICNDIKTYSGIEKAMLKALKIICRKENA